MSKRPKTSYGGIGALGFSGYNSVKLRSINSEMGRIRAMQRETSEDIRYATNLTLNAIKSVADLQIATVSGLVELDNKLDTLSSIAWDVKGYLERKEKEENFVGDLKMIVLGIEDELEKILEYSKKWPEYAIVQIEDLQTIIKDHDVRVEHFSKLSVADIKWAKQVIESVDYAHFELNNRLGD